ncbi:MAG: zinc metallopeptidase [Actinobacteria bacterium]|nr:zinc metallopeptidase [Actinomycetota bacterium]
MNYWLLLIVTLALGLGAQAYINSKYKVWSRVLISSGETGAMAARRMLDSNGLSNIPINVINGKLSDNYDPKRNVLNLSQEVYNGRSVAATAIACHEAGHAVQHAKSYAPANIRMALVPAVNFVSSIWMVLLFIGFIFNFIGLVYAAIALYAIAVLFQIVTLPVEFNASSRAIAAINGGRLPEAETRGARTVLTAAALTYVAAALASLLQLLYFVGISRD